MAHGSQHKIIIIIIIWVYLFRVLLDNQQNVIITEVKIIIKNKIKKIILKPPATKNKNVAKVIRIFFFFFVLKLALFFMIQK